MSDKIKELLRACINAMHKVEKHGCLEHLDCADDGGEFWYKALTQAEDFLNKPPCSEWPSETVEVLSKLRYNHPKLGNEAVVNGPCAAIALLEAIHTEVVPGIITSAAITETVAECDLQEVMAIHAEMERAKEAHAAEIVAKDLRIETMQDSINGCAKKVAEVVAERDKAIRDRDLHYRCMDMANAMLVEVDMALGGLNTLIAGSRENAIRKLQDERDTATKQAAKLEAIISACYSAFTSYEFMDPPDGGDPGLAEMVRRLQEAYNTIKARKFSVRLPSADASCSGREGDDYQSYRDGLESMRVPVKKSSSPPAV